MKPTETQTALARRKKPEDTDLECALLDTQSSDEVVRYEQTLYANFFPMLEKNPLIRNLWDWNDTANRLRTRVPYSQQEVFIMRDLSSGKIVLSVGVNLAPHLFWQTGSYGFACPDVSEKPCEFLIMAHGDSVRLNGVLVIRKLVYDFIFPELYRKGYHTAYATTADHLRRLYRWIGAEIIEERMSSGYRRSLLRWDLQAINGHRKDIAGNQ